MSKFYIRLRTVSLRTVLMAACVVVGLGSAALTTPAHAQEAPRAYAIAGQDLGVALRAFATTSGKKVDVDAALVKGKTTSGARGQLGDEEALRRLLAGSGLISVPAVAQTVQTVRQVVATVSTQVVNPVATAAVTPVTQTVNLPITLGAPMQAFSATTANLAINGTVATAGNALAIRGAGTTIVTGGITGTGVVTVGDGASSNSGTLSATGTISARQIGVLRGCIDLTPCQTR